MRPEVEITQVFLVDCAFCGAIRGDLAAFETREAAADARRAHLAQHREEDPTPAQLGALRALDRMPHPVTAQRIGYRRDVLWRLCDKRLVFQASMLADTWGINTRGREYLTQLDEYTRETGRAHLV